MANRPIVSDLFAAGHAVLPTPQRAVLTGETVAAAGWSVTAGRGVAEDDIAVRSLAEQLAERTGLAVSAAGAGLPIELAIDPAVAPGELSDARRSQTYRLTVACEGVGVTGGGPAGLFYGVQTLVQLLKFRLGRGWTLPACRIDDWPALELRIIHYDTKHHQDRVEAVRGIIARAAHFKINAVAWEIEDKFAYRSHPLIGAPGAHTADELRGLTAFALERHVQIIPILQMPSHNAFIAKHEAYARLRENRENNYMLCPSRPETRTLYRELIGELVDATPGCRFFHLGTDEPYFLGQGTDCPCAEKIKTQTPGAIEADLIREMTEFLAERGREVMYWGEAPLTSADVPLLPAGTINAVMQSPEMSRAYKARGIRELVYVAAQGSRALFPGYWPARTGSAEGGTLSAIARRIRSDAGREGHVAGAFIAAWDDVGHHVENFWLGWVAGTAVAWNLGGADTDESVAAFMSAFYGPGAADMELAYRLLNDAADFWIAAWDQVPSRRGPSYFGRYHARFDRTLALPHVPDPDTLDNRPFWRARYGELIAWAEQAGPTLARLIALLAENILRADRERYNIEALMSVALLIRHHGRLIRTLASAEAELDAAREAWGRAEADAAVAHLRSAGRVVRECIAAREETFASLVATWEKGRLPKGISADGRRFVHVQDDTKNHTADRTADMGYLVMWERGLDLEGWLKRLDACVERFAAGPGRPRHEPKDIIGA